MRILFEMIFIFVAATIVKISLNDYAFSMESTIPAAVLFYSIFRWLSKK